MNKLKKKIADRKYYKIQAENAQHAVTRLKAELKKTEAKPEAASSWYRTMLKRDITKWEDLRDRAKRQGKFKK